MRTSIINSSKILISDWPALALTIASSFFSVYPVSPRFFYESLPLWMIAFSFLIKNDFSLKEDPFFKKIIISLSLFLIAINTTYLINEMHSLMKNPKILTHSVEKLTQSDIDPSHPLFIIDSLGLPLHQTLQTYKITTIPHNQCYEVRNFTIIGNEGHFNLIPHYTCTIDEIKNFLKIYKEKSQITLHSTNLEKIYFTLKKNLRNTNEQQPSINKIQTIPIPLNKYYQLGSNPQILLWLYKDETLLPLTIQDNKELS